MRNCPECGSSRLVSHPDLSELGIAHMDCDAFFAAIEKRDAPELRSRPVIVGGGKRGVVSTCCYIARMHGVRSAMPMFQALKACPDAVVVKPDFSKYSAAARQIREKMDALTPLVQAVSIDEAYLDLSGTRSLHGAPPAVLLARLALEIEKDVGITVSIGLSANRFLAKTASEMDKPRGFVAISPEEAPALLAPHPPSFLHGVGPKLAARLSRDGYETVADLQAAGLKTLIRAYGETGQYLHERAHGIDRRPVNPDSERKSVSSETTFNTDISDPGVLTDQLWQICENITRRVTLPTPTQLARTLFDTARPMLARETESRAKYRLIGIGISTLSPAKGDVVDLIDPGVGKRAAAERASDAARAKFGRDAVLTGRSLRYLDARDRSSD